MEEIPSKDLKRAVRTALRSLEFERRKHIFSANLFRKFGADNPTCLNADARVVEIDRAVKILREVIQ